MATVVVFSGRAAQGIQTAGGAHKNDIKYTEIEHGTAGLGNICDVAGGFPDREGFTIDTVHQHLPGAFAVALFSIIAVPDLITMLNNFINGL